MNTNLNLFTFANAVHFHELQKLKRRSILAMLENNISCFLIKQIDKKYKMKIRDKKKDVIKSYVYLPFSVSCLLDKEKVYSLYY